LNFLLKEVKILSIYLQLYPIFLHLKKKKMFDISLTEWIGYLASLVLMISFLMKNINTLRIINSIGAILFVVYGIMLVTSWPIIITNTFILGINIYYLSKHFRSC
jgi:cytosine/uracil/thiamine/allantoin permease